MITWKKTILGKNKTIYDAVESLSKSELKIVLVTDKNFKLLGTVTDGDIRRSLLKKLSSDTPLHRIMNKKPIVLNKNQSKKSIFEKIKTQKILQLPIVDKNMRVIGIETIENLIQTKTIDIPVLLMAGGYGKRLMPFTKNTPKPLLKIKDKTILERIIENLFDNGFRKFYISTHYKSKMITDYFGDGKKWNVSIKYIYEKTPLGTAGAIGHISNKIDSTLIVMNCDILSNVNFEELLNSHFKSKAQATICTASHNIQIPFGVVKSKKGTLETISEKPTHSFYVSAGIYVLNKLMVRRFKKNKKINMPEFLTNQIKSKRKINVFPINEFWLDIGHLQDFQAATKKAV